jgi:hypothetical protein
LGEENFERFRSHGSEFLHKLQLKCRFLISQSNQQPPNVAIVKNIPENNARLWKVKHLVKITPINFPHGEPSAQDLAHTVLKENGDCIVVKNIEAFKERVVAAEDYDKLIGTKILDSNTLKRDSRMKWVQAWDTFSTN